MEIVLGGLPAPRARRRALWTLAALLVAALLVDLGAIHHLEHGDSLVPVLVSLQRWTPFYWDQERYGMLVPLLALPVRDPLANLLLQRGLLVLAGLAAVVLLARHVLPGRDWPLAGALAAGLLLVLAPPGWRFEYLGDQPYGLSLALALAGLAVAEPGPQGRRGPGGVAAGLLLVLLAHWVNAATGVLLGALALARGAEDLADGEPPGAVAGRLWIDAALLAAGLAFGVASVALYPALTGQPLRLATGFLPPAEWPAAWGAVARRAVEEGPGWLAALAGAAAGGVGLLSLAPLRPLRRAALVRAGALLAAALLYAAFAGALRWVAENGFHWRYLAPAALLVHLAAISLLAEPVARAARLARPAFVAAAAALPLLAVAAYGPPSLAVVREGLAEATGGRGRAALAAGCDLLAGDYWTVWPAVFDAELARAEAGAAGPRRLHGITHRSNPTIPLWLPRRGEVTLCVALGEERVAERWLRDYGLWPVREVGRTELFRLARIAE